MDRKRKLIGLLIGSLGVVWSAAALAADQVPKLDVQPGCRAAAERIKATDYASVCVKDELRARDKMQKSWAEFKAADRNQCLQLSRLGGKATYTELLTCLEMARDARTMHEANKAPITTGQAPNQRTKQRPMP